jgi:hypothetical protein
MRTESSSEYEYVYVRKPINITVPMLGDLQARKNPFNKQLKAETLKDSERLKLLTARETKASILHSRTLSNFQYKPYTRLLSMQVQQPTQLITETSDSVVEDSSCWMTESESDSDDSYAPSIEETKEKIDKDNLPHPSVKSKQTLKSAHLSKEVEHNFAQIQKLTLATQEEIALKEVFLSYDSKYGRISNKTLVLDLDDTLIHTINPNFNYATINISHSNFKTVLYQDKETSNIYSVKVVVRPYAIQLLEELAPIFEIIVRIA